MRKLFRSVFAVVSAALFFAAVPVAAETFHVFVLTGQSNSLGAIKGNFADAEYPENELTGSTITLGTTTELS